MHGSPHFDGIIGAVRSRTPAHPDYVSTSATLAFNFRGVGHTSMERYLQYNYTPIEEAEKSDERKTA